MALAAGCSSSSSGSSGGNTHGLHLTYTLWDPVQEVGYKKSIALLEKSHPGISVNVEQIPYPDYEAKLTSEFSSGSGPFLAEAENSGNVETLPAAPEAGQVIVSPAADLGPAWLGDEPGDQGGGDGGQRRQPGDPAPVTVARTQS